ncbi:MAG: hypothetical protein LBN29_02130 [Mediterranea sp.]|jgi:hypothetical protein|nr:hypothetical protein [Mediterranea sp.]
MKKRNVFYRIACVFLVLGMSGCGNDVLVSEPEEPAPVPTPDINGLVTLRIGTAGIAYQEGIPATRAQETPVTFTQDLGDGYMLESTLVPSARTRTETPPLEEGTTVVVFTVSDEDAGGNSVLGKKVTGCGVFEVGAGGRLTIKIPVGVTPKLVFYTEKDATVFDPSLFLQGTGISGQLPVPIVVGEYYPLTGDDIRWSSADTFRAGLENATAGIYKDAMVAMLTDVDTDVPATHAALDFYHLFTELIWQLDVNADIGESIGKVRANYSPRTVMTFTIPSYLFGAGSFDDVASLPTEGIFESNNEGHLIDWKTTCIFVSNEETTSFLDTARIDPSGLDNWEPVLYIDTLVIKSSTGDATYTYKGISIAFPESMTKKYFEHGKTYTVKSKLTKRLTWATSNIYWDKVAGKLTFDAEPSPPPYRLYGSYFEPSSTTANSGFYQGVLFRWGSLVALSPKGDPNTEQIRVYLPSNVPATASYVMPTYSPSYAASSGVPEWTGLNWSDIPGYDSSPLPYPIVADENEENYFGDICAYLTKGMWRLPTNAEMMATVGLPETQPAQNTDGWWTPDADLDWDSLSPAEPNDEGNSITNTGTGGNEYVSLTTKWGRTVRFTKTVDRHANGEPVARAYGLLWTRSGVAQISNKRIEAADAVEGAERFAAAARCVK